MAAKPCSCYSCCHWHDLPMPLLAPAAPSKGPIMKLASHLSEHLHFVVHACMHACRRRQERPRLRAGQLGRLGFRLPEFAAPVVVHGDARGCQVPDQPHARAVLAAPIIVRVLTRQKTCSSCMAGGAQAVT